MGSPLARPSKRPPPKVVVTTVQAGQICETLQAIGTTQANESAVITSPVSEKVVQLHFEEGQKVQKGDLLVTLSQGEELSELSSLEAQLLELKPSYERSQTLFEKRVISKSELEEKEASLRAVEAQMNAVKARLKDRIIRAPFSGILGFRHVSPGSLVEPGDPITTLYDLSKVKMTFEVPARYLSFLKTGLKVTAQGDAYPGEIFQGRIWVINPSIDPMTRLISIKVILDNESEFLKPGLFLTASLKLEERTGLMVPEEALVRTGDEAYLYFVDKGPNGQGVARQLPVGLGERAKGLVEIKSGAKEGDQIVFRGLLRGQKKVPVMIAKDLPFKVPPLPDSLNCQVTQP